MAEEGVQTTTEKTQLIEPNNTNTRDKTDTETEVTEREETKKEMKPWEQHWGVISIPRFDYNAPSSLLCHSHSGFLITCTIKREKSATKEAMSILAKAESLCLLCDRDFGTVEDCSLLCNFQESYFSYNCKMMVSISQKYLGSSVSCNRENLDNSDESSTPKRRKTCTEDLDGEHIIDNEIKDAANNPDDKSGNHAKGSSLSSSSIDTVKERDSVLSLVKLTRSGLLLFTFTRGTSFDTVRVALNIIRSLESEGSASPQWCHRIFPIQATCSLNEKELHAIVSKLVLEFVNDKQNTLARPLKFAVGYNRRGVEETEMKIPKDTSNASTTSSLLDRNSCFSIVAAAVKEVVPDSAVDLKSPELSVLIELLPLSGVPSGSLVVAVSVLPQNLVSTKPRLCVKPLVSSVKAKGGKH